MLRRLTLGAAAAAFGITALLASSAGASGACDNIFEQDIAGVFYAEVRSDGGQWVYMESNGVSGLQRGGSGGVTTLSASDEHCGGANPDTIVY